VSRLLNSRNGQNLPCWGLDSRYLQSFIGSTQISENIRQSHHFNILTPPPNCYGLTRLAANSLGVMADVAIVTTDTSDALEWLCPCPFPPGFPGKYYTNPNRSSTIGLLTYVYPASIFGSPNKQSKPTQASLSRRHPSLPTNHTPLPPPCRNRKAFCQAPAEDAECVLHLCWKYTGQSGKRSML
jgi:hypothetical protein